jgi:hypothetical protein
MIEQQASIPETVEATAFLNHLLGLAGLSADHPLAAEAVAACGLADRTAFTGAEMQAIETAIAQKVQLKLAVSNNPDVDGLRSLILSVNRIAMARRESY